MLKQKQAQIKQQEQGAKLSNENNKISTTTQHIISEGTRKQSEYIYFEERELNITGGVLL